MDKMSQLADRIRSQRRTVLAVGIPGSVLLSFMVAVAPQSAVWLRQVAFGLGTLGLLGFGTAFFLVLRSVNEVRDHWTEEYGEDWLEERGSAFRDGQFQLNGWYGLFGLASFSDDVDDYVRESARSYLALGAFLLCPAFVFTASVVIRSLLARA